MEPTEMDPIEKTILDCFVDWLSAKHYEFDQTPYIFIQVTDQFGAVKYHNQKFAVKNNTQICCKPEVGLIVQLGLRLASQLPFATQIIEREAFGISLKTKRGDRISAVFITNDINVSVSLAQDFMSHLEMMNLTEPMFDYA